LPAPIKKTLAQTAAEAMEKVVIKYGLSPSLIGREFHSSGRRLRFIGIKTRNFKTPIVLLDIDKDLYHKCPVDHLRLIMARDDNTQKI